MKILLYMNLNLTSAGNSPVYAGKAKELRQY